jgi:protein-tyrosine phosphatase
METKHRSRILGAFRDLALPLIESLDIPDEYNYMDEELVEMILQTTEFLLKRHFGIQASA